MLQGRCTQRPLCTTCHRGTTRRCSWSLRTATPTVKRAAGREGRGGHQLASENVAYLVVVMGTRSLFLVLRGSDCWRRRGSLNLGGSPQKPRWAIVICIKHPKVQRCIIFETVIATFLKTWSVRLESLFHCPIHSQRLRTTAAQVSKPQRTRLPPRCDKDRKTRRIGRPTQTLPTKALSRAALCRSRHGHFAGAFPGLAFLPVCSPAPPPSSPASPSLGGSLCIVSAVCRLRSGSLLPVSILPTSASRSLGGSFCFIRLLPVVVAPARSSPLRPFAAKAAPSGLA